MGKDSKIQFSHQELLSLLQFTDSETVTELRVLSSPHCICSME